MSSKYEYTFLGFCCYVSHSGTINLTVRTCILPFCCSHGNRNVYSRISLPKYFVAILGVRYLAYWPHNYNSPNYCNTFSWYQCKWFIVLIFKWNWFTANSLVLGTEDGIQILQGNSFMYCLIKERVFYQVQTPGVLDKINRDTSVTASNTLLCS